MPQSPSLQLLIAEDSTVVRERLVSLARQHLPASAICSVATGADAVAVFDRSSPDAVLLDLGLPDMTGFEVLEHIRRRGTATEVVVFTNWGGPEMAARCHLLGASHFVSKAHDIGPVIEILRTITAPKGAAPAQPVEAAPSISRSGPGGERGIGTNPVSVLVVEDDNSQADLLVRLLPPRLPQGSSVSRAGSLAEALDCVRDGRFEVVLLDLGLPDCEGAEAVVALRLASPAAAIIVLSAHQDDTTVDLAMRGGADDYFIKGELEAGGIARAIISAGKRQRSARALTTALESRRRIMDSSVDVICTLDAAGRFVEVGAACERLWGYAREELIGRISTEWTAVADRSKSDEFLDSVRRGATTHEFENQFVCKDGSCVDMMWSAVWSADDRLMYCVAHDITKRKAIAAQLGSERAGLVAAQAVAKLGSWEIDLGTEVELWSAESYRILELDPTLTATHQLFLEVVHPDDRAGIDAAFFASLAEPSLCEAEHRLLLPDGRVKYVHQHWEIFRDEQGQAARATGTIQDVTERVLANEALQREREFLSALVENVSDGIVSCDANGVITFFNGATREFHGLPAEPVAADRWAEHFDIYMPDGATRMSKEQIPLFRALQDGSVHGAEMVIAPRDGMMRRIVASGRSFTNERGEKMGAVVAMHDVTEAKEAEEKLSRSHQLMEAVTEGTTDAIYAKDREGRYLMINTAGAAFLGRTPAEVIGCVDTEFFTGEALQRIEHRDREIMRTGEMRTDEDVSTAEGITRTYFSMKGPLRNAAGEIVGLIGYSRDISKRKQAEAALRQSEAELRTLVESIPQIVWITEPNGQHTHYNQQWIDYTGLSIEESLGDGWNPPFHPEDRGRAAALWQAATDSGTVYEIEYRLRRSDGVYHWMLGRAVPLRDGAGKIAKWFGTCTDIEELKQAEQVAQQNADEQRELAAQLASERVRLVTAQSVAKVGDWQVDFVTQVRTWSAETYRIFELEMDQAGASHERFMEIVHPDDRAAVKAASAASINLRTPAAVKHRLLMPDGRIKFIEQRWQVVHDHDGTPLSSTGTVQDITERAQAEEVLRQSQMNLAFAQSVSHVGSWEIGFDGVQDEGDRDLNWSDEEFRIFGFEPGAVQPTLRLFFELVHPDDREPLRAAYGAAFASADAPPYDFEHRITWPDGTEHEVHEQAVFLRDEETGAVRKVVGTTRDVTSRNKRERTLVEQAEMLNLAHDAIVVRGIEDRIITFWNTGAEHLYGWTAAEAIGRRMDDLVYDDPEQFLTVAHSLALSGEFRGEVHQVAKDGRKLVVSKRANAVPGTAGRPGSVLIIERDITEHRKLENQFLRAQRLESIGTLASGVAHDLNNVLAPILMSAPLLREELTPALKLKIIDTIETSAERGAQIVKQVLTFARGVEGDRVLVDPRHLIKEMAEIAQQTFPKTIVITTRYAERLDLIEGDPTQLHQVLLNLAVNARDAMPSGGKLLISAENLEVDAHYAAMTPDAQPGPHVLIIVSDTGTGIPPHVMEKMFDPFFTTKEIGKGSGLGLSTVLGIVKSHGGVVNAYSTPHGTTFRIHLPAAAGQQLDAPQAEAELPLGHGETVLLVDDEPAICEVAKVLLTKSGYKVLLADDGPAALAIFAQRQGEISVVITDLLMPIMNGLSLARIVRKMNPAARIVLSSGREDDCAPAELNAIGIAASLTKPYTQATLLRTLHDLLHDDGRSQS